MAEVSGRRGGVRLKTLAIRAGVGLANAAYGVLKLLPVQDKVVFLTWNSDVVTPDFAALMARLRELPDPPRVVALCRELRRGVWPRLLYGFHMFHQMYAMATAKVVVLDAYCVVASMLRHRPELKVVQLWHALGAFKKFGWSVVDKPEGWSAQSKVPSQTLSRLLRMHQGYTAGVVSCSSAIPHFAEAYRCDPAILQVAWLPRVDALRDERVMADLRARILAAHPELAQSPVVLYAPTIRLTSTDSARVAGLVEAIHGAGWNLVAKGHRVRGKAGAEFFPDATIQVPEFSAIEMLAVAEAVITDYSAIVYEAYLRGIPVYFYAHDMAQYEQARGFYTRPADFPATVYDRAEDLVADMDARTADLAAIADFVPQFLEDSENRVDILELIKTR